MILLHLEAKPLRTGAVNPKNYPYRQELIEQLIKEYPPRRYFKLKEYDDYLQTTGHSGVFGEAIIEIDTSIPLKRSIELIQEANKVICIDSYLQHLCWSVGKQAIVLWGQSDPKIFGHKENINLLKDRKYLRKQQHDIWEQTEFNQTVNNPDAFVEPDKIMEVVCENPTE